MSLQNFKDELEECKKYPKFLYGDRIRVKGGFYAGNRGTVKAQAYTLREGEHEAVAYYRVILDRKVGPEYGVDIHPMNLQLVEKERLFGFLRIGRG